MTTENNAVGSDLPHTPQEQFNVGEQPPQPEQEGVQTEHFNMMPPEDELEWLRGQYMELREMLDAARQGYSQAGQEASTLRRVLASKAPTLRERAAIAAMAVLMAVPVDEVPPNPVALVAEKSVMFADALIAALKGDTP